MTIDSGLTATITRVVTEQDLADALGSGDVPVLATPRLIAWMEAATVSALHDVLPEGSTTVGTSVQMEHLAASLPGTTVVVTATVTAVAGKSVDFTCEAMAKDQIIARGRISRVHVDRQRFLARVSG